MSVHVHTTRDNIRGLAARWEAQWHGRLDQKFPNQPSPREVLDGILKLDPETCTVADLAKVASYLPGWIRIDCDSCHMSTDLAIEVGDVESDDWERNTAKLCPSCLTTAIKALP